MTVLRWHATYAFPGIEPTEDTYPDNFEYNEQEATDAIYVLASDYDAIAARLAEAERFMVAAKEFAKGCSCASPDAPWECFECRTAYLVHVRDLVRASFNGTAPDPDDPRTWPAAKAIADAIDEQVFQDFARACDNGFVSPPVPKSGTVEAMIIDGERWDIVNGELVRPPEHQ